MRTIVKGKNVEVPDRVRSYAERKLHRLERLLDDRTDAIVEFSNEMHRSASDAHIAEVTLVIDGRTLRSHAVGVSYQAALDDVVDKVERQAVDYKEKPRLRARPEEEKRILRDIADGTADNRRERRIVKTKRFAIEPMFEEDAVAAMEELGHKFFVFVNPPVLNQQLGIRRSYLSEARRVAAEFLKRNLQVIVFAQSRLATEILTTYLKDDFENVPGAPERIRGYRGGYLPLRRREIEKGLRDGQVRAVVSTNALELGIDIGALDVSLMAGYPGTVAATWQRAGRAGRRTGRSAAWRCRGRRRE